MTNTLNYRNYPHYIGMDRIFAEMVNTSTSTSADTSYPPYNVISTSEDNYIIEMAIAGFDKDDITVSQHDDKLFIKGDNRSQESESKYLHKGISTRKFNRTFVLKDYVVVKSAEQANGILVIHLEREVPEELKPRVIDIK